MQIYLRVISVIGPGQQHSPRPDKAAEVVHMAVCVEVSVDTPRQPDHLFYAQVLPQHLLDVVLAHFGVAILMQQALCCCHQRSAQPRIALCSFSKVSMPMVPPSITMSALLVLIKLVKSLQVTRWGMSNCRNPKSLASQEADQQRQREAAEEGLTLRRQCAQIHPPGPLGSPRQARPLTLQAPLPPCSTPASYQHLLQLRSTPFRPYVSRFRILQLTQQKISCDLHVSDRMWGFNKGCT